MAKEASAHTSLAITQDQISQQYVADYGLNGTDLHPQSLYKELTEQCRAEWEYCYRTQNGKVQKWLNRLKLYNNQKRDDDAVGDTTLFTIHNSVLSALYDDELTVEFSGRNEGNEDIASNLNAMARYDTEEMQKSQLDYFWWWDTLFFGKGLVMQTAFDRKRMCPVPELIDPTTWQQDPECFSMNGDMIGNNAARFGGRDILKTKPQLEKVPSVFDVEYVKIAKSTKSLIDQARQSRQDAQGLNQQIRTEEKDLGVNAYYQVTEWFTHYQHPELTKGKVKKILVWLANDRSKVIRFKILPQQDRWPITERSIFPTSHDFYGTSITDLVEDKQRMKAVLLNLGINLLKADLFGMYLYDRNHIKSRADLNFDFNKFVGVDLAKGDSIENIIQPMNRQSGNSQYFSLVMNILDTSAQRSTATPDMQQGQLSKMDKTATELNKADQNVAKRYSLAAKIAGWSEKDFWYQWYFLYKKYFKSVIDSKVVVVQGVFAPSYPEMTREMIIGKTDPNITINSKFVSQQQRTTSRTLFGQFAQILMQTPDSNKRYVLKKLAKLHDLSPEEIDQLLPPTVDERKAREENVLLNRDELIPINPNDNHEQHLEQHAKARPTSARYAHVATHMRAMEMQKTNPELFPGLQQQQQQQQLQQGQAADTMKTAMQKKGLPGQTQGEQTGMQLQ
jgi:hypothetical protein